MAWAKQHRVEPPAELVAAVADHAKHAHPAAHTCCHKKAHACAPAAPASPEKTKKTTVYGFHAFKCHGIATLWVTTGAVAPPVIPPAWTFDWSVVGTVPTTRFSLAAVPLLPAVPPPRVSGRLPALAAV
jgi:hypothetical protein